MHKVLFPHKQRIICKNNQVFSCKYGASHSEIRCYCCWSWNSRHLLPLCLQQARTICARIRERRRCGRDLVLDPIPWSMSFFCAQSLLTFCRRGVILLVCSTRFRLMRSCSRNGSGAKNTRQPEVQYCSVLCISDQFFRNQGILISCH